MGMKILRPVRQVAVQGLLDWECVKESVNRLLDTQRVSLLSSFPFLRPTGKNMKVWNIGNAVGKEMLKGTNVSDKNALKTPLVDL